MCADQQIVLHDFLVCARNVIWTGSKNLIATRAIAAMTAQKYMRLKGLVLIFQNCVKPAQEISDLTNCSC